MTHSMNASCPGAEALWQRQPPPVRWKVRASRQDRLEGNLAGVPEGRAPAATCLNKVAG
jgi:hypothetical protein